MRQALTQEAYTTFEECVERDLWESMEDAVKLGVIHSDQQARFWYEKERGMRWLNHEA